MAGNAIKTQDFYEPTIIEPAKSGQVRVETVVIERLLVGLETILTVWLNCVLMQFRFCCTLIL